MNFVRNCFIIIVFTFSTLATPAWAIFGLEDLIDRDKKKFLKKEVLNKTISIAPQLNKLTVDFGVFDGGEYYYVKTLSRLFFADKAVEAKITDMTFDSDGVSFRGSTTFLFCDCLNASDCVDTFQKR